MKPSKLEKEYKKLSYKLGDETLTKKERIRYKEVLREMQNDFLPTHCDKKVISFNAGSGVYRFECSVCGVVVWGTGMKNSRNP